MHAQIAKWINGWTDRQMDGRTDTQTMYWETDRQTDRQAERETGDSLSRLADFAALLIDKANWYKFGSFIEQIKES
jgi:hypothetical protein